MIHQGFQAGAPQLLLAHDPPMRRSRVAPYDGVQSADRSRHRRPARLPPRRRRGEPIKDETGRRVLVTILGRASCYAVCPMAHRGPLLTVDVILRMPGGKIVLVERGNAPYGYALPGGFVEYGETVEAAAARETLEETALEVVNLHQFRVYSDPGRDPRQHTVSVVFVGDGRGRARAGSDAKGVLEADPADPGVALVFDHARILRDYVHSRRPGGATK
jgi:8-oxo-dGTP diphosphatase